ncbi:hypothetical protein [Colwellia sp. RSH04]|uniref:hypothetical protein n=1 Tax=Colwellia sp. RSH04 TaxID=2305464 RepID=UPI000E569F29|nr:hypothetical protein [Colwellia sp. RSH04]RHW76960.1 hypothetical protein D1094_06090 [Colwellia sp. RSH04]
MKKRILVSSVLVTLIAGCSSSSNECEDITLAAEQLKQCQSLHKQIMNAKGQPILRTELERRYQNDCIDIRYYRDDQQLAKCGNKHKVEKIRESAKAEAKQ